MGEFKNSPDFFRSNDDGLVKVTSATDFGLSEKSDDFNHYNKVAQALQEYRWRDEDFLLVSYPRTGTHLAWEIMCMLVNDSSEYIKKSKVFCSIDFTPVTECHKWFPSPTVLNTHFRVDVLPKEFRGRKTVLVLRNPKDTAVSYYLYLATTAPRLKRRDSLEMEKLEMLKLPFSEYLRSYFMNMEIAYGNYLDYVEYMWSLRYDPNLLIVYYEDLVQDLVSSIQKINEFMGTKRTPELVQQIADAMNIDNMRGAKAASMDDLGKDVGVFCTAEKGTAVDVFRKGQIGDWKNYFSVADNEFFDSILEKWSVGKEIPFRYEV